MARLKSVKTWARRVAVGLLALVVIALGAGYRSDRGAGLLEARYATPPSRFIEVEGLRMHYRDRGSGPAVVLVHGSYSSLFTWEGWVSTLAVDHRVVTVDMPGHGLTGPDPRGRYSHAEMAELLDAFASAIGLDRFTIGGNSMGGSVAWHYAILHPGRVENLILVDSAGLPRQEPRALPFRLASSPVSGPVFRWVTPRFLVARSVRDVYGDPSRVTAELVDRYYDLTLRDGNRQATRDRFDKPEDDLYQRLGEIHVPTLILWGSRDRWMLLKYGEEFHARIAGSKLVVLDGLGHVPMEEDPVASIAPVRELLAR